MSDTENNRAAAAGTPSRDLRVRLKNGLGGRLFAKQRALLLTLSSSNLLSGKQRDLVEGLNQLLDEVADQAERQGEDCLIHPCTRPPDLEEHVRLVVLASLPPRLPRSREDLASLVAAALCSPGHTASAQGRAAGKSGAGSPTRGFSPRRKRRRAKAEARG